MERLTYRENGKWRLRVGDTEFSGEPADKLAAYEDTVLEPEEIIALCEMNRRAKMVDMLRLEESTGVSVDRLRELVLKEREERSKGCSFCSGMIFLHGDFSGIGKTDSTGHRLSMYTEDTPDFNFCPMCGRPLKD